MGAAMNPNAVALWRSLVSILSKLAPAALSALPVLSASIDSERIFSIYNDILVDNRQSLTTTMLKFNVELMNC